MAHLPSGLDSLVSELKDEGADAFKPIREFVDTEYGGDDHCYDLLLRKGVYPYSYFKRMDAFNERDLPAIRAFHNDLTDTPCSDADYAHAQEVWSAFRMETLKDFCGLYVKSDVLLLSAVFNRYRDECLDCYGLDPLHYFTSPG